MNIFNSSQLILIFLSSSLSSSPSSLSRILQRLLSGWQQVASTEKVSVGEQVENVVGDTIEAWVNQPPVNCYWIEEGARHPSGAPQFHVFTWLRKTVFPFVAQDVRHPVFTTCTCRSSTGWCHWMHGLHHVFYFYTLRVFASPLSLQTDVFLVILLEPSVSAIHPRGEQSGFVVAGADLSNTGGLFLFVRPSSLCKMPCFLHSCIFSP